MCFIYVYVKWVFLFLYNIWLMCWCKDLVDDYIYLFLVLNLLVNVYVGWVFYFWVVSFYS